MLKKKDNKTLDINICNELIKLTDHLIMKQFKTIDEDSIKRLDSICGNTENYIKRIYDLLLNYLKKPHSEIRYNSFYLFNYFFNVSHYFRNVAVENLKSLLDLTVGFNDNTSLPPPKVAAEELKRFALQSIKEWAVTFGPNYKKLNLCYEFLARKKKVDFCKLEVENIIMKKKEEEIKTKKQMLIEKKLRLLKTEINELLPEINNSKQSLESCLKLLVPTPEQFFINKFDKEEKFYNYDYNLSNTNTSSSNQCLIVETDVNDAEFREAGMIKGNFSIDIKLPQTGGKIKITETEENSAIIENAAEYFKLLNNKYIVIVKNWIKSFAFLSDNSTELKNIIDMKRNIEEVLKKYRTLTFQYLEKSSFYETSDTDSEMEDVTPSIPTADEKIIATLKSASESKPSTSGLNLVSNVNDSRNVNERKRNLLKIAPKLPFDIDLYHWEEEKLTTPLLIPSTAEGRQFWTATTMEDNDGIPNPEGIASLRTRIIEFTGKFEPVKWQCRFTLPNGKLCPRQDRFKCPFHGKIVARDERGKCTNLEDEKKDKQLQMKTHLDDAQNPKLLAAIQKETGLDLRMPIRKKRKHLRNNIFTDLKKEKNTVQKRLEKKLFKKSTVKKIAKTLDNLDHRRFRDKFGDQFQYVHGTTYS